MLKVPDQGVTELLDLADFFDALEPRLYDQRHFGMYEARCICGWCNERKGRLPCDTRSAARTLGLPLDTASKLFNGNAGQKKDFISKLTGATQPGPKDAARVLRHLAVAGEVPADW